MLITLTCIPKKYKTITVPFYILLTTSYIQIYLTFGTFPLRAFIVLFCITIYFTFFVAKMLYLNSLCVGSCCNFAECVACMYLKITLLLWLY